MAEVPKSSDTTELQDDHVNEEVDKEVLAPHEGPREDLIKTAVKFLQNPRVRTSPLSQKRSFLERKGLSPEEIRIAVESSGVTEDSSPSNVNGNRQFPPEYYVPPRMASASVQHLPSSVSIPPLSLWTRTKDLTFTTVIVASVSYGVYQLFQACLRPLIFGKTAHERRIEKLETQVEQIHRSVVDSIAELGQTLQAIQVCINAQQSAQPNVNQMDARAVTDLKSEIASLKGLLLNRSQFPPAPAMPPMLPSWQRISTSPQAISANLANQSSPSSQSASQLECDFSDNDNSSSQRDEKMDEFKKNIESSSADGVDKQKEFTEGTESNSDLDYQD